MSTKSKLSKISKTSTNNFDPSDYSKPGVSITEIEEIKEFFDLFADKETGLIDAFQIREELLNLGERAQQDHLHYTLQCVLDKFGPYEGNETIDFQQFLYLMTSKVSQQDSRMDINRLFNLYDNGRNGHLTAEILRQIANEYGIWVQDKDIESMIQVANKGGDGKCSMQQFYALMANKKIE